MWMTVKRIACEEVGVGENGRVELFRFSFFLLPLLPSPSAPFTHKIQQQSCGSYTNFFFFFVAFITWQAMVKKCGSWLVFFLWRHWFLPWRGRNEFCPLFMKDSNPVKHALKRTCNCIRKNGELIWRIDSQRFRKTICSFCFCLIKR